MKASFAVTVTLNATPAVCGDPAVVVTMNDAAAAGVTEHVLEIPVIVPATVSVAVMVWLPTVFKVALNA